MPGGSTWRGPPGCVPSMNHSVRVSRVHGPGAPPDQASIVALTTPGGGDGKLATGQVRDSSRRNDDQMRPGPSAATIEKSSALGAEWSLLPVQTDATICGAPGSAGGAR